MKKRWWHNLFVSRVFCPKGFLVRAAVIVLIFLVLHFAGARHYVSVFSSTSPTGGKVDIWAAGWGLAYAVFSLGVVVVVPILAIGAAIFAGLQIAVSRMKRRGG